MWITLSQRKIFLFPKENVENYFISTCYPPKKIELSTFCGKLFCDKM